VADVETELLDFVAQGLQDCSAREYSEGGSPQQSGPAPVDGGVAAASGASGSAGSSGSQRDWLHRAVEPADMCCVPCQVGECSSHFPGCGWSAWLCRSLRSRCRAAAVEPPALRLLPPTPPQGELSKPWRRLFAHRASWAALRTRGYGVRAVNKQREADGEEHKAALDRVAMDAGELGCTEGWLAGDRSSASPCVP
jgi:hypothetical protein